MNRKLKRTDADSFSFHTWYIAQGGERLPGFNRYSALLFFAFAGVLVGSLVQFWHTMAHWQWALLVRIMGVALLAMLNLAALGNIGRSERKTRILKEALLRKYRRASQASEAIDAVVPPQPQR